MENLPLYNISPVDGRYHSITKGLSTYFSEGALIRYRVMVEIEYFIALCRLNLPPLRGLDHLVFDSLRQIYRTFTLQDAIRIKDIEKVTNHDVKAVEYFLKEKYDTIGLAAYKEFIHFGLTSQDINNTALPCSLRDAWNEVMAPLLRKTVEALRYRARQWKDIPMLARTHGQPASPTRVGKEIYVFVERLEGQLRLMETIPFSAKFGGATGNFNAHCAAYPQIDWQAFGDNLVEKVLGLSRSKVTTQIEHYDNLAAFFDNLKRINTILIDLNRDMWSYISMDYFKQKIAPEEVGSSAMPHKVNPIDFENSEGNLGIANACFEHLAAKLPISRLQRDLTDSTVTRNIGVPIAHMVIGLDALLRGLNKLILNQEAIRSDLQANWAVVAEAIQTILRREGYPEPFEALKKLTRIDKKIDRQTVVDFVQGLAVSEAVKEELLRITPETYIGVFNM